ncbi:hypothetical protein BsWGS_03896 [Bradybaena similaris]
MLDLQPYVSFVILTIPAFGDVSAGFTNGSEGFLQPNNHNDPHNNMSGKDRNDSHGSDGGHADGHGRHGGLHVAAFAYAEVRDPLIFTIVVLLAGISKIGYHHANFLSSHIPESCILIILGTVFGSIIHFSGISNNLPEFFKPHEFFIFLLPPIILEAAYSLHDRTFTENIGSILLFAVLGTILACAMLGATLFGLAMAGAMGPIPDVRFLEVMIFSSLIVAVDPVAVLAVFNEIGVNHVLYFLVFGESLLNDGVTVVLYKVFQAYNAMDEITGVHIVLGVVKFFVVCLGGLALGILAGIASAVLTKFATHVKVVQPIIIFTMAYLGFLAAELFELSGIISIIGCGLIQMQYAFNNISDKSRTTIKYFTKVISNANEIIIFLFLGLSLVNDDHVWHTGFTIWTILLCLVYRFIITFAMSYAINKFDIYRVRKISVHEQFMISYGGLRGAVCFSLVALLDDNEVPRKNMFVTTTLAVIMFTVFIQGITIKPLVHLLRITLAPEKYQSMYNELNTHITDHLMAGIEDIIGDHGRNHLREKLQHFDGKHLKPILQVAPDPKNTRIIAYFENLLLKEHYRHLKLSGVKTPDVPKMPHVNTELLLSTLAGTHPLLKELPILERTEVEPSPTDDVPQHTNSADVPTITFDLDTECVLLRDNRRSKSLGNEVDIDAKGLRNLLLSQRNSRMVVSKYDKNLTSMDDIRTEIHRKTRRNKRLERMVSQHHSKNLARGTSWSEEKTQVCEERSNHGSKTVPRHAATVDFGNSGRLGTFDPLGVKDDSSTMSPFSVASPLGSVFEDDEEEVVESQPMLDKDGRIVQKGSVRSNKSRLERQMGLDRSGTGKSGQGDQSMDSLGNLKDDIVVSSSL